MSRWKITNRPGLKITYEDLLNSPQWKVRRREIIKRDGFKCQHCGTKFKLQIHHKYYENGNAPWEYPNGALITLCECCHWKFHAHASSALRKLFGANSEYYKNTKRGCV